MKRIRGNIEPGLMEAGFELEGRNYGTGSTNAWLDYLRPGLILRCLFDSRDARLIAETMNDTANCRIVANIDLSCLRSSSALLERVDEFPSAVTEYARELDRAPNSDGA